MVAITKAKTKTGEIIIAKPMTHPAGRVMYEDVKTGTIYLEVDLKILREYLDKDWVISNLKRMQENYLRQLDVKRNNCGAAAVISGKLEGIEAALDIIKRA